MRKALAIAVMLGLAVSQSVLAQDEGTPGVTEISPGVRTIDGAKVPSTELTKSRIEAAIAEDNRFKSVKKLFDVKG
ncbi:MAG: hypothetical protein AAFR64_00315, partial [Pseudomonadota bacterium]